VPLAGFAAAVCHRCVLYLFAPPSPGDFPGHLRAVRCPVRACLLMMVLLPTARCLSRVSTHARAMPTGASRELAHRIPLRDARPGILPPRRQRSRWWAPVSCPAAIRSVLLAWPMPRLSQLDTRWLSGKGCSPFNQERRFNDCPTIPTRPAVYRSTRAKGLEEIGTGTRASRKMEQRIRSGTAASTNGNN